MKIKNIVFFCPSRLTGGHEYLFVHLAEYLLEKYEQYDVYYCDYPDGFSHTRWYSEKVNYIDYESREIPVTIPSHSVVIAQLNLISQLERFVIDRNNSFFIFWELHSLNIKGQIYRGGHYWLTKTERRALGKEIRFLFEKNVVKTGTYGFYAELVRDFYQEPDVFDWLPNIAPIKVGAPTPSFSRLSKGDIRFCWLGRLDEEKARNIVTYMNELEEVSKIHQLSLTLIGRGPAEETLKNISKQYSYPISFVGEKRDNELDCFIRNETEVGLASGTSAYEFSLRGQPVIMEWVIDRVYPAGERNTYIFTEEEEQYDYSSGHTLKKIGESTFMQKLNIILNNYGEISRRGYDYVMNKSAENCAKALIRTIESASSNDSNEIFEHVDKACSIIQKGYRRIVIMSKLKNLFGLRK